MSHVGTIDATRLRELSPAQAAHFLDHGWVMLEDCFDPALGERWIAEAFADLGYDRHDPATWREDRPKVARARHYLDCPDFSSRLWRACGDLVGGVERIDRPFPIASQFILSLGPGPAGEWYPPEARRGGWHVDGDFFRHFLDSPEQGLLIIVLWSDVVERGGPTYFAPDSIAPVARTLAARPEGLDAFRWRDLIDECREFRACTGRAGSVALLHPYMLHAPSPNLRRMARVISNPPLMLREPMCFDRADPAEYSLVERAVLRALEVERLPFAPTRPRARRAPDGSPEDAAAARRRRWAEIERRRAS